MGYFNPMLPFLLTYLLDILSKIFPCFWQGKLHRNGQHDSKFTSSFQLRQGSYQKEIPKHIHKRNNTLTPTNTHEHLH